MMLFHNKIFEHLRKVRKQNKRKKFLSKSLDEVCLLFSVIMPLTTIPQIVLLYDLKDATGLSLLMWVLYTIGVIPFFLYGVIHKIKHLAILNFLWLVVQTIMIIGIIIYS